MKALSNLIILTLVLQVFSGLFLLASTTAIYSNSVSNDVGFSTFSYEGKAATVKVAGSFTEWESGALNMIKKTQGQWELKKDLPAGTYQYKFIVDGKWILDHK
jgi:pullulanase